MKKSLLAMAVGAAFLAPGASFAADTKVYGKFNIGFDHQSDEIGIDFNAAPTPNANSWWKFRDNLNSSRLGFKGSEDVGLGDLKAIYQLEYGINPDGSEAVPFSERNLFVGVSSATAGTLKFGRYDTSIKEIGANVDEFNDTVGDITNIMAGETRNINLIQYATPKFGDMVQLSLTAQPGEHRVSTDNVAATQNGLASTYYAAVTLNTAMVDAGVAYAKNEVNTLKFDANGFCQACVAKSTASSGIDILRGTVQVKVVGLEVGALAQQAKGVNQTGGTAATLSDAKETSFLLSAGYTLDALKFKAEAGQTKGDQSKDKRSEGAVGVDYKLSKALVTQVYYVAQKHEDGANLVGDLNTNTYGVALVYSF